MSSPTPTRKGLINLFTPDALIQGLQVKDQRTYLAIKNIGTGARSLINTIYPSLPVPLYRARIIIPGTPAVANDILAHRYHVVMPQDPSGNWKFNSIILTGCTITAKVLPTTFTFSADIKVCQLHGDTTFKSIFKSGFNPKLPPTFQSTHNVEFAINTLYQDYLGRVDVLVADPSITGIEIVLMGYYNISETPNA